MNREWRKLACRKCGTKGRYKVFVNPDGTLEFPELVICGVCSLLLKANHYQFIADKFRRRYERAYAFRASQKKVREEKP